MSMLLDTPVAEQEPAPAQTRTHSRLQWQWEHLGLGGILLLAGFFGLWNLTVNNYSNEYYAAAVRSMIQSWHNFFFVSFDPGGFVTVDKPPVAFWVQAAFAKVLGFNGVSLLLPEALAGIAGVFLLYYMVKRAFGAGAGLLAGLFLAVTPIWVVMNRDNNPDSILVFTLLLAAWALSRAAEKGKLGWVILSGVLVGVAFNVKMLEAYVVLPAFYAMYFLFARTSWRKRIVHLVLASLVIAAVSFSWAVAVDLTPASQRPYVDSSSVNSEMDLIINYNGLGRVDGNERATPTNSDATASNANGQTPPNASGFGSSNTSTNQPPNGFGAGANGQFQGGPGNGGPGGGGAPGFGGQPGVTRLLTPQNGGEFGWFMPLAILGMIYLAVSSFFGMAKGEERSRRLQSVMLWGGWLLIYGVIFSFSKGVFHNYYLTIMAPAQAALAGSAMVMLWRSYRRSGWQGWLLPVGLAATAFYQAYLLTGYTTWNQWLSPALIIVGLSAAAGLVLARIWRAERAGRGLAIGVAVAATAALLVVPTVWSIRAVFTSLTGSIVSGTPSGAQGGPGGGGPGGFGNESSTDTVQNWWSFISNHLGGQLWLIAGVVAVAALLVALRYALRQRPRWFSLPVASGLLLVFLVAGSGSWWIGAAQAQTTSQTSAASNRRDGGFGGPGGGGPGGELSSQLVSYLQTNQDGYQYLVAVSNSQSAASAIIETGQPVMAIGGFSGSDNTITSTAQLEQMIANHTVRYFLIGGDRGGPGGNGSSVVSQYVTQQCKVVDSSAYSSTNSTTSASNNTGFGGGFGGFGGQSQQLYVCGS